MVRGFKGLVREFSFEKEIVCPRELTFSKLLGLNALSLSALKDLGVPLEFPICAPARSIVNLQEKKKYCESYHGIELLWNLDKLSFFSCWIYDGGVLVLMVSCSLQSTNYTEIRKFLQTFFLAIQQRKYIVLHGMFQFTKDY